MTDGIKGHYSLINQLEGRFFTKKEIENSVAFQEKFFDIEIMI